MASPRLYLTVLPNPVVSSMIGLSSNSKRSLLAFVTGTRCGAGGETETEAGNVGRALSGDTDLRGSGDSK